MADLRPVRRRTVCSLSLRVPGYPTKSSFRAITASATRDAGKTQLVATIPDRRRDLLQALSKAFVAPVLPILFGRSAMMAGVWADQAVKP